MTPARRCAPFLLAALCALTSCGIPTTGVVEAGGPASGVVPTVRVYFVADGSLLGVPRPITAPVDVRKALEVLFQGPGELERAKRIGTALPPRTGMRSLPPTPEEAQEAAPDDFVTVTEREDGITVELSRAAGRLPDLAVAQIVCTATAARHVTDPREEPVPVTVEEADGRPVDGADVRCPEG
ncbi:hypothetical protein [Streptomyces sp. NPDC003635]